MRSPVRPKKHLGQHFLKDENIAARIAAEADPGMPLLEIGPGTGILTRHLLARGIRDFHVIEIDEESVAFLSASMPELRRRIIQADYLAWDSRTVFPGPYHITGNFPYNISSQILFRVLEERDRVLQVTGMFQKEVAERISSPPGNRDYGILSVLLQVYYKVEYLFTVSESVFQPPPKVKSGVVKLTRNKVTKPNCDEALLVRTVKAAFGQRRKTLRNALKTLLAPLNPAESDLPYMDKRAEQLGPEEFILLTDRISNIIRGK